MSDRPHDNRPQGNDGGGNEPRDPLAELTRGLGPSQPEESTSPPRRAASLTLTTPSEQSDRLGASLDPAQQSLTEALRITFFILQLGMFALVGLFLLSGAQQIGEAERGVRLTFGEVVEQDVPPGLHLGWPYPVGEFITVPTGQSRLDLDTVFFPNLNPAARARALDQLAGIARDGLNPATDGSLVTADGSIVHMRPTVVFRRERPGQFIRTVLPGTDEALVRAAVERGAVRAVAQLPLEAILKQTSLAGTGTSVDTGDMAPVAPTTIDETEGEGAPDDDPGAGEGGDAPAMGESGSPAQAPVAPVAPETVTSAGGGLAASIRRYAQETLDAVESGIVIEEIALRDITPPLAVRQDFMEVQAAEAAAVNARQEAEQTRRERLNAVAGQAAQLLLDRIDAYEEALELGEEDEAQAVLAQIDALLLGEPVRVGGEPVARLISGEATRVINEARNYRTEIVARNRALAKTFEAKLEQFRTNPRVLLSREWSDAFASFLDNPFVETMLVPSDASFEMLVKRDPELTRRLEQLMALEAISEAAERRTAEQIQRWRERQRRIMEQQ